MLASRHNMQLGFSLIETLISLLVLSVGLLGLGGLQLSSLKGANNAHYRTVASIAATDMIDRMRANPLAVANDNYSAKLMAKDCHTKLEKVCESGTECSAEELAKYDLHRVNCGVSEDKKQTGGIQFDLPQAALSLGCTPAPCTTGAEHLIRISWNEVDDDDADSTAQARSYELIFIP